MNRRELCAIVSLCFAVILQEARTNRGNEQHSCFYARFCMPHCCLLWPNGRFKADAGQAKWEATAASGVVAARCSQSSTAATQLVSFGFVGVGERESEPTDGRRKATDLLWLQSDLVH